MQIEIVTTPLHLHIHGFSGVAVNKDYVGMAFLLMDKMWKIVKDKKLKNKGLNIWVYESGERVFAGVELDETLTEDAGLEEKDIRLSKYGAYKHVGPYNLIRQAGQAMTSELQKMGYKITQPYIEIYGHWTNDESKLETDLIVAIEEK
jgi:predicted transcriptional regulator YdeE